MVTSKLRLNDFKTEVLVITSKNNVQVKDLRVIIGEETIIPKTVVRNMGPNLCPPDNGATSKFSHLENVLQYQTHF